MQNNPRFPIYIVSKGRWESRLTVRTLEAMRVPYRIIVEAQECASYASVINPANILVLDPACQRDYDACCDLQPGQSKGSGPARNFAWDHARAAGAEYHWCVDDNIDGFYRCNRNAKILVGDGWIFRCMEDFVLRYENVAMAGPNYEMFVPRKERFPPFYLNTRIYSCNLIRTNAPFRWRARYNEDTDLSLRMLKAGWCTILFNAFLQHKKRTLHMKGGNMDELYKAGTYEKSKMLVELHPDVARLSKRFKRWHHHVDYRSFRKNRLRRRPGADLTPAPEIQLVELAGSITYADDWREHVRRPDRAPDL